MREAYQINAYLFIWIGIAISVTIQGKAVDCCLWKYGLCHLKAKYFRHQNRKLGKSDLVPVEFDSSSLVLPPPLLPSLPPSSSLLDLCGRTWKKLISTSVLATYHLLIKAILVSIYWL